MKQTRCKLTNIARVVVGAAVMLLICASAGAQPATTTRPSDEIITVFSIARVEYDKEMTGSEQRDGYIRRLNGHVIEATVKLPPAPANQREARRITATVQVDPVMLDLEGRRKPGDPWTRLGSVTVLMPGQPGEEPAQVELLRFITGFGGAGTFTQDVTSLAPMLHGPTTIRLHMGTYFKPGWDVSLKLAYSEDGVGQRRPTFAQQLFHDPSVDTATPKLSRTITIPSGLDRPRIRIISSGHASDGTGGDEFVTRTHILRIDGKEIVRWRPWLETGGMLWSANPMSGRKIIDGRVLRSSDFDRSGWAPNQAVQPLLIPAPELSAGQHQVELEIQGIRPKDESGFGYWFISAVVVADEPWPPVTDDPPPRGENGGRPR